MASPIALRAAASGLALTLFAAISGCDSQSPAQPDALHASSGQVKPVQAASVSYYAAARFADQVSFGATPALIAEIRSKGFEKWIDDQYALPVSLIDTTPIQSYDSQIPEQGSNGYRYAETQLHASFLTAPDQLRRRVAWSLSQYIVTAMNKIEPYGSLAWSNFLQKRAFGNYGDLIRDTTTNPTMGWYLDNLSNRPTTTECPWCAPNENYARELMQLFTLGVVKLNPDGSTQRDSAGRPIETYSQKDVEDLARALTGWSVDGNYDRTDFKRHDGVLKPDSWSVSHDRGAKAVMGKQFPGGVDAARELDSIVALLMGHQNIAPFVSLRLIQHLVTSDPTPQYIARVSAVFRNNGQGVAGDMKAVIKAILLDPEARRGDQLGADSSSFGKVREPLLWYTGLLRGLACTTAPKWSADADANVMQPGQRPFDPASVFSFYLPTDRAPGSNLLAPEQRLLNSGELSFRLGNSIREGVQRAGAACNAQPFGRAYATSPAAFADLVNERFFRGAMPAVLRQNLIDLAPDTNGDTPDQKAISLLQFALATPYYGVIR